MSYVIFYVGLRFVVVVAVLVLFGVLMWFGGMLDFVFIVSLIWVSCWEACVLVVAGLMFGLVVL